MSIKLRTSPLQRLREITLVANTPGYLFNAVVEEDISGKLAGEFDARTILRCIRKIAKQARSAVQEEDVLTLIALAIALRYKDPTEAAKLRKINASWLRWWDELRDMVTAESRSDKTEIFEVKLLPTIAKSIEAGSATADRVSTIDLRGG